MQQEINLYKISIAGACFMALLGLTFAYITSSSAILLDGLFSLINLFMSVLTLKVAKLLTSPGNDKFHFGFTQTEPLLNTFKGLVIAGVMIYAFSGALNAMFKGGRPILFGKAILYAVISVIGCAIIALKLKNRATNHNYPLLELEAKGWIIDTLLSSVALLTFIAGYYISKTNLNHLVNYIDPTLVIVISIALFPIPYKTLKSSIRDLLLYAPPLTVQEDIVQYLEQEPRIQASENFDIKSAKMGRYYYVEIIVLVNKENSVLNIKDFDTIRDKIHNDLKKKYPKLFFSMEFTADPKIYSELIENKR
jgi:cation diffusion facilitator family transporter